MLFWIIVFFLGLAILHKVRKIIGMQGCPQDEDLQDYFEGRLKRQDQDEYERIISHLGICEKCQNRLTALADSDSNGNEKAIEDHLI